MTQKINALAILLLLSCLPSVSTAELLFSEYVEGSAHNKALELYNNSETTLHLAAYQIEFYFNGHHEPGTIISFNATDTLAAHDVWVIVNAAADDTLKAKQDQSVGGIWFNGDDSIVLKKNNNLIDVIGQLAVDPGSAWGSEPVSTQNHTLRRQATVCQGDNNAENPFEPAAQWQSFAQDNFDNLGSHNAHCAISIMPITACGETATPIHVIQGSAAVSPEEHAFHTIEAVVISDFQTELDGFFVQEETIDSDADPLTSEGLFIYEQATEVNLGDTVRISGQVQEYFGLTELTEITEITHCGQDVQVLEEARVILPLETLEALERFEGMLVRLPQTLTVIENYDLGRYGEVVLAQHGLMIPTQMVAPGEAALAWQADNERNRITLDDNHAQYYLDPVIYPYPQLSPTHTLRRGDTVGDILAVLGYRHDAYRLYPIETPEFTVNNPRPTPPESLEDNAIRVASFNVLNYFNGDGTGGGFPTARGADTLSEFNRQRDKIIQALVALDADIIGLMEIENDGYDALSAIQDLVNGLNAVTGNAHYAFIDPQLSQLGDDEITVGLMYRAARVQPVGAAVTYSEDGFAEHNRQPLVQTFEQNTTGERLTVAVNHFKSKGSSCADSGDPDQGDGQGHCNLTRLQAAETLTTWLATDPTQSNDTDVLIIGDLNAYAQEDPIQIIETAGYTNLIAEFIGEQAYSYVFFGQAGYLDHALASATLTPQVIDVAIWPINADEPRVLDYNEEQLADLYHADPYRSSDHDPVIVTLQLQASDNQHCEATQMAVYSNITRQAFLPCIEIPLYTDIDGQTVSMLGLYSGILEIPFGFSDFRLKELTFLQQITESTAQHAKFFPESGQLEIPQIEVTTIIPYLNDELISGPVVICSVQLQQSVLRPEVLSLTQFECHE
ncbi:MAG: ExeM/NucH family extracellular endonuclease [Pseudomonadota bacterium]|nr:ExeM/NucH family extracellular endonuclease [Pseudomonadota bacterium]